MEIIIQFATIENLKEIQNLNHQLCIKENKEFDATVNKDYPIQTSGENYFKERIKKDCALVATTDDKIVGYLVGAIIETEEYRNISKLGEAENMFVLEEYRSLGIGKKLFHKFIEWCKSKGAKRIRAVASAQNIKAIEFYKKEGFSDYNITLEKEI
ncbi:MAG: GNAT family N-acetyltransferase [Candidatus Woesearchaeota archaeon]|jgi:GNAT superfamily N-acetyltransferase